MFVHRPIQMSDAGIVVSGHHKASEAGAAILRQGGNAIGELGPATETIT
jgi:gamma-glutamyltranspeptidase